MTHKEFPAASPATFAEAAGAYASGVTLVTVADGRDDIGTTVSAFCPVSTDPAIVAVSLAGGSYAAELLGKRCEFAVTFLAASQRALAGRFAAAARPGARLLLDGVPHHRGELSGALIADEGLAALECQVSQQLPAGDHQLFLARVLSVRYVAEYGAPLIRYHRRYLPAGPS